MLALVGTGTDTNKLAYGGYGHNYPYLGYYEGYTAPYGRQKFAAITRPTETIFNSDTVDPLPTDKGVMLERFGYSYSMISLNGTTYTYTRHGQGDNYALADGHVQLLKWKDVSVGQNGDKDYYWRLKK